MFQILNRLGVLLVGRRPEYNSLPVGVDGSTPPLSRQPVPLEDDSGRFIKASPRCQVLIDPREDMARHTGRVTIDTLDNSAAISAVINGTTFSFTGSGTETELEMLEGLRDDINGGNGFSGGLTFATSPNIITINSGTWAIAGVITLGPSLRWRELRPMTAPTKSLIWFRRRRLKWSPPQELIWRARP